MLSRQTCQRNHVLNYTYGNGLGTKSDLVACTCNPATLESEFRNGVGSIPVGGNSPSVVGWIV